MRKEHIPYDLITEILSRLPAKSIARFRCVSKQWGAIFHRPDFPELFLTVSSARPRLLFAVQYNNCKWYFLSAPQPQNPDKNLSSLVVDHHKFFPMDLSSDLWAPVHGLICTNSTGPMICNPSTGEYMALPKLTPLPSKVTTLFVHDPINKVFKVLYVYKRCQVLTLGTGQLSWRMVECEIPHIPVRDGICINGIFYYLATCLGVGIEEPLMVVCFDVRFEKFNFFDINEEFLNPSLINCKGKLGTVQLVFEPIRIELLVLDDVDKEISSKHIYVLPPLPSDLTAKPRLRIVGMTCTGEFVLSLCNTISGPFSIFYYNVERNTLARVEIEFGIVASEVSKIYTFVDHIENVKLMQMLRAS